MVISINKPQINYSLLLLVLVSWGLVIAPLFNSLKQFLSFTAGCLYILFTVQIGTLNQLEHSA